MKTQIHSAQNSVSFRQQRRAGIGGETRDCYSRLLQINSITIRLVPVDCNWPKTIGGQRAVSCSRSQCGW
jgi:hypothetical protein